MRKYELRWTGNIKPNGQKELVWVKINRIKEGEMTKTEKKRFIRELVKNVEADLLSESSKYPKEWDGVELRWRISDVFSRVVFGGIGQRKGKRYLDYRNFALVYNLK